MDEYKYGQLSDPTPLRSVLVLWVLFLVGVPLLLAAFFVPVTNLRAWLLNGDVLYGSLDLLEMVLVFGSGLASMAVVGILMESLAERMYVLPLQQKLGITDDARPFVNVSVYYMVNLFITVMVAFGISTTGLFSDTDPLVGGGLLLAMILLLFANGVHRSCVCKIKQRASERMGAYQPSGSSVLRDTLKAQMAGDRRDWINQRQRQHPLTRHLIRWGIVGGVFNIAAIVLLAYAPMTNRFEAGAFQFPHINEGALLFLVFGTLYLCGMLMYASYYLRQEAIGAEALSELLADEPETSSDVLAWLQVQSLKPLLLSGVAVGFIMIYSLLGVCKGGSLVELVLATFSAGLVLLGGVVVWRVRRDSLSRLLQQQVKVA